MSYDRLAILLCKECNSIKICRRYVHNDPRVYRARVAWKGRRRGEDIAYLYPGISLVTGVPLECLTDHTPRLFRAEN